MQRAAFRQTLRVFSESTSNKAKQTSFTKSIFTDTGNIPLVLANAAGCVLVVSFMGRKVFFHPDVGVSSANRFSNDICNETSDRVESAMTFRSQTRFFGSMLTPLAGPIMTFMTGSDRGVAGNYHDKWSLEFLKNTDIEAPLESTNHFDDDLFTETSPCEFSLNTPNDRI
jgi:hypothetical protein